MMFVAVTLTSTARIARLIVAIVEGVAFAVAVTEIATDGLGKAGMDVATVPAYG